jgi:hypothetical protein
MSDRALRWAFTLREVSEGPRLVLLALAFIADETGTGEMKIDSIAFMANCSRRSAVYHLGVLEAEDLLRRDRQRGRGKASQFRLAVPASKNMQNNVQSAAPFGENVQKNMQTNVQVAACFDPPTHAGVDARGELSLSQNYRVKSSANGRALSSVGDSPISARAREVADYVPSPEILQHLNARGLTSEELSDALGMYREQRMRNTDPLTDANFRHYVVGWWATQERGDPVLRDMSKPAVSRRMQENVATAMHWQPPERRRQ